VHGWLSRLEKIRIRGFLPAAPTGFGRSHYFLCDEQAAAPSHVCSGVPVDSLLHLGLGLGELIGYLFGPGESLLKVD